MNVTLTELAAALPHYSPSIVGTGGNVVALSLTVDDVPILVALGDGTQEGDSFAISTDYADRPDMDTYEGTCWSVNDVADVLDGYVAARVWSDDRFGSAVPRVMVYASDDVVDDAADWDSDRTVARYACRRCGEWLYRDNSRVTLVYRAESDESSLCDGPTVGAHEGTATYWRRTDAL